MKKIRVLFTIPNFDTAGSGKALLNIAKGLDAEIFEAHIMCLHNRGAFFKVVESSGLPVHVYNYIAAPRPISKLFKQCWKISGKFKEIAPDVIHSYHYAPDYTEALASKMAGIPWVFTKKNMNWGGSSKNAWNLRSFLARKIAVQNTDMIKQFYPKSKKTVLIPRGVNVSSFKNTKNQEVPMQILDFPDDKRYLICVANLVPVKGVEILIHAFHKILAKHPKWHLLVVGDDTNDYGDELKQLVSELTMDDKITFTGKQLDILPFLDKAEVFILPTKDEGRREGSPVSLLEAMANGKVVIGSDIPGIRDQLAKFPDSLFKASNIDDLSQKLEHYMSQSPEELKRIGTVFYNHVHLEYPLKKEIKRHEDLYRMIIK